MNLIIKIFALILILNSGAMAYNKLLLNKGVIDIGHNQANTEVEVPKEVIARDPSMQITNNAIVYRERIQSEPVDCENDFLSTETCPISTVECPTYSEFVDGYSNTHTVVKYFEKICGDGTVRIGDKCYVDQDNDTIIDDFVTIRSATGRLDETCASHGGQLYIKMDGTTLVMGVKTQCGNYRYYDLVRIAGATEVTNVIGESEAECLGSARLTELGGMIFFDHVCSASGNQHPVMTGTLDYTYTQCPSGAIAEGTSCYYPTHCPVDTVEQTVEQEEDNSSRCKMQYDWYSYHCPGESSIYDDNYQVINTGHDCGNPSCSRLTSATPPTNNCIRANYRCPLDPSQKCGKTLKEGNPCNDGYVWNNNRCERIESYCGTSFYNAGLDICQNITHYTKLCHSSDETYNVTTDRCESRTPSCPVGTYRSDLNKCIDVATMSCPTVEFYHDYFFSEPIRINFAYNASSGLCENPSASPCQNNYTLSDAKCIGSANACPAGETYNETSRKCEISFCGTMGTVDSGTRCEKDAPCEGTISGGVCVPNVVQ